MKAALFDLDGVLIDTEGLYTKFWEEAGKKYKVPFPDFAQRIKGTTMPQILDTYFPKELHATVLKECQDYDANLTYPIFPGVIEYLKKLKAEGIPCAIVTSSPNDKMERLWKLHPGLREMFDAVVTDQDVSHSKPDPEPFQVAASKLGADPRECWIFEDSYNGLLSGRRAGGYVVALSTTNPAETLSDKADRVISSFLELL